MGPHYFSISLKSEINQNYKKSLSIYQGVDIINNYNQKGDEANDRFENRFAELA